MTDFHPSALRIGGGSSVSGDSAPPPPPDLGAANFRKDADIGLTQETTLVMNTPPPVDIGLSVEQFPAVLLTEEALGLSIDTFASGTIKPANDIGLTQGSVLTMQTPPAQDTGFRIEQTWDYTGTKYGLSVINDVTSPDNFSNPGNAAGAPDGSNASRSGQALNATQAFLKADTFDAIGTKDSLNIDKVELRFYAQQTGTVLNNGIMRFRWGLFESVGSSTTLVTYTDDQNFLTVPDAHDITGSITDWDDIRNINMWVEAVMDVGEALITVNVNAFEIHIEASLVE